MTARQLLLAVAVAGYCLPAAPAKATHVDFREVMGGPNTLGNQGFVPQSYTTMTERTVDFTYHALHIEYVWGQVTVDGGQKAAAYVATTEPAVASFIPTGGARFASASGDENFGSAIAFNGSPTTGGQIYAPGGTPAVSASSIISPSRGRTDPPPAQPDYVNSFGITGALASMSSGAIDFYVVPETGGHGGGSGSEQTLAVPLPPAILFLTSGLLGVIGAGRMRKSA